MDISLYTSLTPFLVTLCLILFIKLAYFLKYIPRNPYYSKQKIHTKYIPRFGGVAIYIGLLIVYIFLANQSNMAHLLLDKKYKLIILASLPLVVIGFAEDITGRSGVLNRLLLTIISGVIYIVLSDDLLFSLFFLKILGLAEVNPILKLIFILFGGVFVAYLANSYNILDGLNGLCVGIFLTFIYFNSAKLDLSANIILYAALAFLLCNWPKPFIFLGDCGAYLLGYITSIYMIYLMINNNILDVILTTIYPIFETVFTVVRRLLNKKSIVKADDRHLHTIIFFKLHDVFKKREIANSTSTLILISINFLIIYLGLNYLGALYSILFFIILYLFAYIKLVKNDS